MGHYGDDRVARVRIQSNLHWAANNQSPEIIIEKNGNYTSIKRLQSPFGSPNESSSIVVSPPLSGHQALDTLGLALFQEHDEGKYSPKIEGGDQLLPSNASSVTLCFKIKWLY